MINTRSVITLWRMLTVNRSSLTIKKRASQVKTCTLFSLHWITKFY